MWKSIFLALCFTDCSAEQPIPRPKNWIRIKDVLYYSGKKKKHTTVKNLYTSNQKGLIVYNTRHNLLGKRHDYRIYKKNHLDLPEDVMSMYYLGFLGVGRKRLSCISKNHHCLSKGRKGVNLQYSKKSTTEITLQQRE